MQLSTTQTRLGIRLRALHNAIPATCDHLYDLCCDHGAIGKAALESRPAIHVTFNDINTDIMRRLAASLNSEHQHRFTLHTGRAADVPESNSNQPCFLIAGVGVEQCIDTLARLKEHPLSKRATFIISPATKAARVRAYLMNNSFSLVSENCVTERKRTYEIITVCHSVAARNSQPISLTGRHWLANTQHIAYLKKMSAFYTTQLTNAEEPLIQSIVDDYIATLKKLR